MYWQIKIAKICSRFDSKSIDGWGVLKHRLAYMLHVGSMGKCIKRKICCLPLCRSASPRRRSEIICQDDALLQAYVQNTHTQHPRPLWMCTGCEMCASQILYIRNYIANLMVHLQIGCDVARLVIRNNTQEWGGGDG